MSDEWAEPRAALAEQLAAYGRSLTHCTHCGRELIDVEEPDSLYDPTTGERPMVVWRQCPRFPRNSIMALFRGTHDSFQRDNPIYGREYR